MFYIRSRYLFVFLLAVYSYLNILFTEGDRLIDVHHLNRLLLFGIIAAVVLAVWEGNRYIEYRLKKHIFPFSGSIHPLITFFLMSLLPVILVTVIAVSFAVILTQHSLNTLITEAKLILGFAFRVNLFLNCLHAIVYYMNQLKKSQLQTERLEKATAEAQFVSLRNQVNPHFLFNSFNVLSSLVYKDADMAAAYIRQLSKVYRYVLYNQNEQKVSLKQEMEFIDAYLYLLDIRFGENLIIKNTVEGRTETLYLAPMSVQMLVENAIKHNIISKKKPLTISLSIEKNADMLYLAVENTLQKKDSVVSSTNLGITNIKQRYKFISNREVIITDGPEAFKVLVPLIHAE